ncbi:MAG TPA: DinB family protein [Dehalococcoidia bacterium]|nr:DinB family protein [Dehalococcoidia bacterium]
MTSAPQDPPRTRAEIIELLSSAPERLRATSAGVPAGVLRRRADDGGWSLIELVCHLRDYAEIFNSRLMRAVSEDNPRVASYDNEDLARSREYISQDLDQVLSAFGRIRSNMLAALARLTEDDWRRTVQHAAWGEPSIEWLMNRCAQHELEHLRDIERLAGGS